MKNLSPESGRAVERFAELGRRLEPFGSDPRSCEVIRRAAQANAWFTRKEMMRAVEALRVQMLDARKIARWLEAYRLHSRPDRNVLVVMAGNVPLVGFFDLMCVVAAGLRCLVKPSSKDAVLMEYILHVLREIDPDIPAELYGDRVDAVIATGSDNTNRYFRAKFAGLPALLRGSRHSVAVLDGSESAAQLEALAQDMFAYSGLGCRNVSMLLLPRGYDPPIETGEVNPKYRNNFLQARALLSMRGIPFRCCGSALLVEEEAFPTMLSRIAVVRYDTLGQAERWLEAHDGKIQCVVGRCVEHPRRVDFGQAQLPTLADYPDGADVMRFLEGL